MWPLQQSGERHRLFLAMSALYNERKMTATPQPSLLFARKRPFCGRNRKHTHKEAGADHVSFPRLPVHSSSRSTAAGRHPSYMGVKCSKKAERNLDSGRPPSPVTGAAAKGALASAESFPPSNNAVVFLFPAPPPSSFAAAPRGLPRRLLVEYWQFPPDRSHRWQGSSPLHLHLRRRWRRQRHDNNKDGGVKLCGVCANMKVMYLSCASCCLLLLPRYTLWWTHFFFQHASHDDLRRERAKGSSSPSIVG